MILTKKQIEFLKLIEQLPVPEENIVWLSKDNRKLREKQVRNFLKKLNGK
jgi:hypothetical protein